MEGRWPRSAAAHQSTTMPTSLRAIVQARLDQLSLDEREVLQVAAVVGQNWTASLLGQVLQESLPIPDLLRHLAEREFLSEEVGGEEPTYNFAHGVTQEDRKSTRLNSSHT